MCIEKMRGYFFFLKSSALVSNSIPGGFKKRPGNSSHFFQLNNNCIFGVISVLGEQFLKILSMDCLSIKKVIQLSFCSLYVLKDV